jgi:hypothetical protein
MVITEAYLVSMKDHLAQINDPRRQGGNFRHNLTDILVIA